MNSHGKETQQTTKYHVLHCFRITVLAIVKPMQPHQSNLELSHFFRDCLKFQATVRLLCGSCMMYFMVSDMMLSQLRCSATSCVIFFLGFHSNPSVSPKIITPKNWYISPVLHQHGTFFISQNFHLYSFKYLVSGSSWIPQLTQGTVMTPAVQPLLTVQWMILRSQVHERLSWLPAKYMYFLSPFSPRSAKY